MYNEFSVLEKILDKFRETNRNHPSLVVPPGDDAALLAPIARPVISTDTQREGVHFRREWQSPFEIGFKAVVVALSDLAASYASPLCLFINLGLPETSDETLAEEIYDGVKSALDLYPSAMGGGNISSSPVLSLDLFVVGEGEISPFPSRSNAKPDDVLCVTGPLGLARAGLVCLQKGCADFPYLVARFKSPCARFDAARILCDHHVTSVMDVSDGLFGDAFHMADASGITLCLDIDKSHIHPELDRFCRRFNENPQHMILSGGEDYELLFTCSPSTFEAIRKHLPHAVRVGSCTPFTGTRVCGVPAECRSYVHGLNKG